MFIKDHCLYYRIDVPRAGRAAPSQKSPRRTSQNTSQNVSQNVVLVSVGFGIFGSAADRPPEPPGTFAFEPEPLDAPPLDTQGAVFFKATPTAAEPPGKAEEAGKEGAGTGPSKCSRAALICFELVDVLAANNCLRRLSRSCVFRANASLSLGGLNVQLSL